MFIAIDKVINQGIRKEIITVPEWSIGSSFATTLFKHDEFFANWQPNDNYNL